MRALKILLVSATVAASVVVGVAGTADAASGGGATKVHPYKWCC